MNKAEFSKFAMALKTYYPRENLLPNTQAMELWFYQLQDIPYETAQMTLNKWVALNKWSPTIADIRETATSKKESDWGEAWALVLKTIGRYGSGRKEEALESLPELARKTVERMGYKELCKSENQVADRANFRMIYEELSARKAKEDALPESLRLAEATQKRIGETK